MKIRMNDRVIDAEAVPVPNITSQALAEIMHDGFELIRQRFAAQSETIRALTERVQDLEGHVEHGPDGTCGICDPEPEPDDDPFAPENVGADEYGQGTVIADFEGECADPFCADAIKPGDVITIIGDERNTYHHDCTR